MYTNWSRKGKIFSSIIFWLPVQLIIICLLDCLGISPSRLSPERCGFGGPAGGLYGGMYVICCYIIGMVYTIAGSILIVSAGLGTRKFRIWSACMYGIYLMVTFWGMKSATGEWFNDGFGCYVLDVWCAPLLWLGELFLAKRIFDAISCCSHDEV